MMKQFDRKIVLEDGSEYYGKGFGSEKSTITELVFHTGMVGYQEILSDPSYTYQTVVMAYPLIGNYGMVETDYETALPTIGGLVVREYNDVPSNFCSKASLGKIMKAYQIPGLSGVDTRQIIRKIRNTGSCKAFLTDASMTKKECMEQLKKYQFPRDAVASVSRKKIEYYPLVENQYHVAVIDCGMKKNIVRCLQQRNCALTVYPWNTAAEIITQEKPDGIFLSNGPGNPEEMKSVIELVKTLRGRYPIFGICLGHQIISLAYGAKTYKMKFGHRGGNHPVKRLIDGKIEITSQNHSYAVDAESLKRTKLELTHVNLLDGTVEGAACPEEHVFGVQYHPESAPGPRDSMYLFDQFIQEMEENKYGKKDRFE